MSTPIGADIYFESTGEGRPVLFLHAGVADSRMWNHQFRETPGARLIRLDMRGYGRTPVGTEPFTNVGDALSVLDRLEIERAVLVGCSIGANTALQICEAAPDRVQGLLLVSADAPGFDPDIEYESPEWPAAVAAFDSGDLARAAELEAAMWLAGIGRSVEEVDRAALDLFVEMDLLALQNEKERNELEKTTSLDRLPETNTPVRVVVGQRDIPQILAAAEHLASNLGDETPTVIPDSAHLPSMDQPERFDGVFRSFLAST